MCVFHGDFHFATSIQLQRSDRNNFRETIKFSLTRAATLSAILWKALAGIPLYVPWLPNEVQTFVLTAMNCSMTTFDREKVERSNVLAPCKQNNRAIFPPCQSQILVLSENFLLDQRIFSLFFLDQPLTKLDILFRIVIYLANFNKIKRKSLKVTQFSSTLGTVAISFKAIS